LQDRAPTFAVIILAHREGIHLRHCIGHAVSVSRFAFENGNAGPQRASIIVIETAANQPASFRRQALVALQNRYYGDGVRIIYNSAADPLSASSAWMRGISEISTFKLVHRPQYFLFLDDSTELVDSALPAMISAMKDPMVAIVGAKSRYCTSHSIALILSRVDSSLFRRLPLQLMLRSPPTTLTRRQSSTLPDIRTARCTTPAWALPTATAPAARTQPPPPPPPPPTPTT
jgi:hypothetical protein